MFDIDACALATGVTDEQPLCMIAGTWSINEYLSKTPVRSGETLMNSVFCLPEYYLIEESSPTSAGNLEWFVKSVLDCELAEAKVKGESLYQRLDVLVEAIAPQESQLLFLPYLFGAPGIPQATAAFFGLTAWHNKAHLARAIFEGVVFGHRQHAEKLLKHRDKPSCIRLSGGVANSRVWVQMFADVLGMAVETVPIKEPGALGCAIAAAVAAGTYPDCAQAAGKMVPKGIRVEPNAAVAAAYETKYQSFCRLAQTLSVLW